jgi:hypothetical protein
MAANKESILEELKNNPKVKKYVEPYDEESVNSFLTHYASTKEMLLQYNELYRKSHSADVEYYRNAAEDFYWQIAQKKLFNQQCLWRAQRIDLPIEVTYEFTYWERNIQSCPFIEPVTETEMNCMIAYLEQATYDTVDDYLDNWQDYEYFRDEETGMGMGDDYPEWYSWYDATLGPSDLMLLPDIRGAYEEKCTSVVFDARNKDRNYPPSDRKPYLSYSQMEDFIKKVEPYKIGNYYQLYLEWRDKGDRVEEMEREIELMLAETEEVWVPEGKFPDAIFQAAYLLKVKKVKKLLPLIHQEHMDRLEMGISYELTDDNLIEVWKQNLREGKKMLGEE